MEKDDNYYMECAYKEAMKAYKINEIPVGAIIVDKNGRIIGRGYNKKEKKRNAIYHAEIEAIFKATKKIKNWRLNDCILYVTLFPCDMCLEVIKSSKIDKIIFASDQNITQKKEANITISKLSNNIINKKCSNIIIKKFSELRINDKNCGKNVSRET